MANASPVTMVTERTSPAVVTEEVVDSLVETPSDPVPVTATEGAPEAVESEVCVIDFFEER